jgi:hypothetical protein
MVCHARPWLALALALCAACLQYTPPAPPPPSEATNVRASFGQTWDAVIDEFADRNIPIRTIERASGLVATEQLTVPLSAAGDADCGRVGTYPPRAPTHAIYNVLVRGDSVRSTVKVTMRWMYIAEKTSIECSTRRRWEQALEDTARLRAERVAAAAASFAPPTLPAPRSEADPGPALTGGRSAGRAEPAPSQPTPAIAGSSSSRFSCAGVARGQLPEQQDELRRLYVGDLRRAGIVKCVEQLPPDLVRVMVGPGFESLPSETREAKLSRLYGMYGSWGRVYLELWTETGKFAEYVDGDYRSIQTPRTPGQGDRAP